MVVSRVTPVATVNAAKVGENKKKQEFYFIKTPAFFCNIFGLSGLFFVIIKGLTVSEISDLLCNN